MHVAPSEVLGDSNATPLKKASEFSLVAGGPLFQLFRRGRLSGDALELVWRRIFALVLVMWLPLLVLSTLEGNAWNESLALPFLKDIETHVRLLIAAPLLILAEVGVNRRLPSIVRGLVENGLIRDEARPRFEAAIDSVSRLRDSMVPELVLILFVYGVGMPFVWRYQFALDVQSWYATSDGGHLQPSVAGMWLGRVSMPLLQFLVLRWLFRFAVWARFLWQVARTRLSLEPAHPDGTAGLHFLVPGRAFALVSLAAGAMVSGVLANKILYTGARLLDFKVEIVGAAAIQVLLVLGPLIVFYPQMRAARRMGLVAVGELGQDYARQFWHKWIRGPRPTDEPLLGSPDIQSLADLHASYAMIRGIPQVPFTIKNVMSVALATMLPMSPLLLTTFSVEQLVERMLKVFL